MDIHIHSDGQQKGPYTLEQINDYLAQGTVSPADNAWHEGMSAWAPLSQVEGVVMPETASPPSSTGPSGVAPASATVPVAMGSSCPQCNAVVPPGQPVCVICGTHLHAASPGGAGKLIAMISGGFLVMLVAVAIIVYATKDKSGALSLAKTKANRIKCVNNISNVYKAGLAFAQDNGERLPWQLTNSAVRYHFDPTALPSDQYGRAINMGINEVMAHPNSLAAAGVYGLTAMKVELVTPKILHSPCDPTRSASSEIVQKNWRMYATKARGVSSELGKGSSYVLVRGADTQRPSSVYALTRNWSADNLNTGKWLGSDSDPGNARTMERLTASQGQVVTMDGGAKQSNNSDFGEGGMLTRAAQTATGGVARGRTGLNLIRGPGL